MTPLLLAACIDNQLGAAGEGESRVVPAHDTAYPSDSAGESGDSSDAPAGCGAAPEGAAAAPQTCTSLPEVAWDMVLEADIQNEVDPANWAYIGAPVVAPLVAGAPSLILYQSWVVAGSGSVVAIDPLAGAVAWRLDNLGNDADHLAVSRDAVAGGGGVGRMGVPTASVRLQCGDLNGGRSTIPNDGATLIGTVDTTHDGVAEFVYDHLVLDAGCVELFDAPMLEGAPARAVTPVVFDFDGSFDYGLVGSEGVTRLADGHTDRWDWAESFGLSFTFHPALVSDADDLRVVLLNTDYLLVADSEAHVLWFHQIQPVPQGECSIPPAIGDVTGDGVPEILICEETWTSMFTLAGHRMWTHEFSESWGPAGGMSMADLDADGRYEVIHWSENGLRILEGATGSVLAENVDVTTRALASEPVIADVDGDGSAEIVITGDWVTENGERESMVNDHLFVFGAAAGRWARTRPIWN